MRSIDAGKPGGGSSFRPPALLPLWEANTFGSTIANAGGPMRVKRRLLPVAVLAFAIASRTGHVTDVCADLS